MTQGLRILDALAEDSGLFSPNKWQIIIVHIPNFRESGTFFLYMWVPGMHMVHIHTCRQNTYIHNKKIEKKSVIESYELKEY